jgi:hypothetical protein
VRQRIERGATDEFGRLHRLFVEHFGIAVALVWLATLVVAVQAPWLRNLRGLVDPAGRSESTASFLFGIPGLMAAAWLCLAFGGDVMRRSQLFRNQALEFGLAGAIAFAVFCLAVSRIATAASLAG